MSLSSFCVVTNALRLNLFDMYSTDRDRAIANNAEKTNKTDDIKEENKMEISVKGMTCPHCEARVKEAMEKIDGVKSAAADHENDLVTLELTKEVAEPVIRKAVEDAGYEFVGIK